MKRLQLWCAAALLPLFAACSFSVIPPAEYTETRTFDLASPDPAGDLPFVVDVETFSNECSGRYKMVVREDANRIDVDDYNRWAMPPGAMLTKYLAAKFAAEPDNRRGQTDKPAFILDGSVLNCEMDKTKKQVDLLVHFFIIQPGSNSSFRITGTEDCVVSVKETSAEAFADGLNKAAEKFADRVVAVLKEELRKRSGAAAADQEKK